MTIHNKTNTTSIIAIAFFAVLMLIPAGLNTNAFASHSFTSEASLETGRSDHNQVSLLPTSETSRYVMELGSGQTVGPPKVTKKYPCGTNNIEEIIGPGSYAEPFWGVQLHKQN